jgi:hypothetical protein
VLGVVYYWSWLLLISRCNKCDTRFSIRRSSWFEKYPKVSLKSLFLAISSLTSSTLTVKEICQQCHISRVTFLAIYQSVISLISHKMVDLDSQTMIGGMGKYVFADESFTFNPKVGE